MKHKILIGGGTGLCGSHLSRYLLDKYYEVVILDNLSESYIENLDRRAKFYKVDIKDFKLVKQIFEIERPDYVYNAQAMAAEIVSPFCKGRTYNDNLITTSNMLSNSVEFDIKKFITFSSIAIWAGHENPPYFEETPTNPKDSYGISKLACDLECDITKKQFGLNYSSVICHNYQGKFVNCFSLYRNFIAIACRQALNNERITVFSDGFQKRQFSHVKYLCEPLEKLLTTDCERVILGADIDYKIIDVANIVKKIAEKDGKNTSIFHLEERNEAKLATCSHEKAKKVLNFQDKTDIEELCYEVYQWMKDQPKRETRRMEYEISKNMYSFWK